MGCLSLGPELEPLGDLQATQEAAIQGGVVPQVGVSLPLRDGTRMTPSQRLWPASEALQRVHQILVMQGKL